jgi:hypothetical protein
MRQYGFSPRLSRYKAAGFLGMSVEMLDRVYGHNHPDWGRAFHRLPAAGKIGRSVGQSATRPTRGIPQPIEIIGVPGRTRTCNQTVMSIPTSPEKSDKSDT